MSLLNIHLENEGRNLTAQERRASWHSEAIIEEQPSDNEIEQELLAQALTGLVTTFIKEEWIEPDSHEPKEELGLMFTVHKKVLAEILNQEDCEGLRIFIASDTSGATKTSMVLKPVDATLEELDKIHPDRTVKFCKTLTECPPETRCPSNSFDTFKSILKATLVGQ